MFCYVITETINTKIILQKATPTQNHSVGCVKEEKVMEETNRSMPMPLWKWNNLR